MPDALDLLTLEEGKRAINRAGTNADDDDLIGRHITAISGIIDDRCGPVVRRTVTNERHEAGGGLLILSRRPVASITVLSENRLGSVSALTALAFGSSGDGYEAPTWAKDPSLLSGMLHRRLYGCRSCWSGTQVTYVAGRALDTTTVPGRFKDAAGAILRRLWKREAGAWGQSATFFEDDDDQAGTGFFRVADPIIEEMLRDEIDRGPLVA